MSVQSGSELAWKIESAFRPQMFMYLPHADVSCDHHTTPRGTRAGKKKNKQAWVPRMIEEILAEADRQDVVEFVKMRRPMSADAKPFMA